MFGCVQAPSEQRNGFTVVPVMYGMFPVHTKTQQARVLSRSSARPTDISLPAAAANGGKPPDWPTLRATFTMNPDKQRIAIAEACGLSTKQEQLGGVLIYRDKRGYPVPALPDYLNDLNAMHEVEQTADYHVGDYCDELKKITSENNPEDATVYNLFHATAAQRAEAFLRTIGKWEEA